MLLLIYKSNLFAQNLYRTFTSQPHLTLGVDVFLTALLAVTHLHHHVVRDELGQGRVPRHIQKLSKTSQDQHGTMTQ